MQVTNFRNPVIIKMAGVEFLKLQKKLNEMKSKGSTFGSLKFYNSEGEEFDLIIEIEEDFE